MKNNNYSLIVISILLCNLVFINYNSFCQDKESKPNWVNGILPNKTNELYSVGRANIGPNKILAEKKADDDARHELGKTMSVKLNTILEKTLQECIDLVNTENTTSQEISAEITKSTTDVTLTGTKIVERWEDNQKNIMYSLVVMKKEQLIEQVNDIVTNNSKKYFIEEKKENVKQKIDDELEKWDLSK